MMTEISLNILDVAENSTKAGATLVEIGVMVSHLSDTLTVTIKDNGCGMDEEQVRKVTDPFYTTRTTRKVGLGVPFFKQAAEATGGSFEITSKKGVGTYVKAVFVLSSIDRMPLGDICLTMQNLIIYHPETDFLYTYAFDSKSFVLDTREFREILGEDIPFNSPEIAAYIMDYLKENTLEVDGGAAI